MRKKIRYAQRATFRDVWRTMELRFKIGLFILLFFVIVGLILPRFNPLDTSQMSTFRKNLPVSSKHLLGTIFYLVVWINTDSNHLCSNYGVRIQYGNRSRQCDIKCPSNL